MPDAVGFDVYGTLVDPLEMNQHLRRFAGNSANRLAELWRVKQVEYSFRRGLMGKYENFGVCTKQALVFALRSLKITLSEKDQEQLIGEYQSLKAFPDVAPGMQALKSAGHKLVAFSNGMEATVRILLDRAGILPRLDGVVSVDDLKTFKPDPRVYSYLAQRVERAMHETWLVSSNPWDIIGAKSAGLKAAWVKRKVNAVFDSWGIEPDIVVRNLRELSEQFSKK